ncbi:hypothetical protein BaRGS_00010319 [Batillaria attramentaria]|uniref:Secreted protein n=1 Tax=Batillaria attramentaria TaxID=370345 RepID=A0ABD0LFZ4_9CAEN
MSAWRVMVVFCARTFLLCHQVNPRALNAAPAAALDELKHAWYCVAEHAVSPVSVTKTRSDKLRIQHLWINIQSPWISAKLQSIFTSQAIPNLHDASQSSSSRCLSRDRAHTARTENYFITRCARASKDSLLYRSRRGKTRSELESRARRLSERCPVTAGTKGDKSTRQRQCHLPDRRRNVASAASTAISDLEKTPRA